MNSEFVESIFSIVIYVNVKIQYTHKHIYGSIIYKYTMSTETRHTPKLDTYTGCIWGGTESRSQKDTDFVMFQTKTNGAKC